jgi:glycerophosphoryl diester phosphodiesterase
LTIDNCNFAKENGLKINTWTVNETTDIEHIKKYDIDGIISDFPDRI